MHCLSAEEPEAKAFGSFHFIPDIKAVRLPHQYGEPKVQGEDPRA